MKRRSPSLKRNKKRSKSPSSITIIRLNTSTNPDKKFMVKIGDKKTVHFGASGYSDYTIHKDTERKENYISRHRSRENWTKSGITTAGWWSRWLLWNKPDLKSSIKDIQSKFHVVIKK